MNGFVPIAKTKTSNYLQLSGDIGKFLEGYERNEYALVLRGSKGSGKSTFLFHLMNAFASVGYHVAFWSLEINKDSNYIKSRRDKYINDYNTHKIEINSDTASLKDIEESAKKYDVVAIDSWSKIKGAKQNDFDRIRKKYPSTIFLVIFQSTTGGTARGGIMPEYDAQVVIQVDDGIAKIEKNRYSEGKMMAYSVFDDYVIDDF